MSLNVVDLFCGCSGLGLGARQAGFAVPLSVDIDPVLTSAHRLNFAKGQLAIGDISAATGRWIKELADVSVDGIVGGPPCQGFSSIGKSDPNDSRRELLAQFFRVVAEVRPRFFVMENVLGLLFEKNRAVLEQALDLVPARYEVLPPFEVDAADFGAATHRRRVFIVGFDPTFVDRVTPEMFEKRRRQAATVEEAISDLGLLTEAGTEDGFDLWRHARRRGEEISLYARKLRASAQVTTGHRRITHRPEVAARFDRVQPGSIDRVGRHPRLVWSGQAPTLRAGTGPERGSYQAVRPLHPSEPRVITVREAARLQGFPDWFRFHPTAWHSFRMIGNSVSPIVARALLRVMGKAAGGLSG